MDTNLLRYYNGGGGEGSNTDRTSGSSSSFWKIDSSSSSSSRSRRSPLLSTNLGPAFNACASADDNDDNFTDLELSSILNLTDFELRSFFPRRPQTPLLASSWNLQSPTLRSWSMPRSPYQKSPPLVKMEFKEDVLVMDGILVKDSSSGKGSRTKPLPLLSSSSSSSSSSSGKFYAAGGSYKKPPPPWWKNAPPTSRRFPSIVNVDDAGGESGTSCAKPDAARAYNASAANKGGAPNAVTSINARAVVSVAGKAGTSTGSDTSGSMTLVRPPAREPFDFPLTDEENAWADHVLYGKRSGRKSLPVFEEICPSNPMD